MKVATTAAVVTSTVLVMAGTAWAGCGACGSCGTAKAKQCAVQKQDIVDTAVEVPEGTTVEEAIGMSHVLEKHPEIDFAVNKVGVLGKLATMGTALRDGDRVEIYRSLPKKPRDPETWLPLEISARLQRTLAWGVSFTWEVWGIPKLISPNICVRASRPARHCSRPACPLPGSVPPLSSVPVAFPSR